MLFKSNDIAPETVEIIDSGELTFIFKIVPALLSKLIFPVPIVLIFPSRLSIEKYPELFVNKMSPFTDSIVP